MTEETLLITPKRNRASSNMRFSQLLQIPGSQSSVTVLNRPILGVHQLQRSTSHVAKLSKKISYAGRLEIIQSSLKFSIQANAKQLELHTTNLAAIQEIMEFDSRLRYKS